ncbi:MULTISPECIES: ROK family transcriptional regulator [unclassified Cryobacterium]|uniref:ROK family transcriptional regulator n=1 Tax=unclassified Cryobacterium TaxID=2649013 RepID=UPI00106D49B6|nr:MULTISPECIES: ROK family transcriptional regulator [unclassified Cryobacterium]TFD07645.1 ROK family transcriptional regulator [Cryobacterium sp. TMT1-66-1]TFD08066.1 ROK family transcriptional regulator [Cryobacterium sp. TMT1-2-2]
MSNRKKNTAVTSAVARVNQTAIIEELRKSGALSRQQLSVRTGLSSATINRLTAVLIEEGSVRAAGHEPSTGGRPSILLSYAGGSKLVAAIQLHPDRAAGLLMDFDGKVVYRREALFRPRQFLLGGDATDDATAIPADREAHLKSTLDLFDHLIATSKSMGSPCLAVGVAVPGVVSGPHGTVGHTTELGWSDVPLGRLLRERSAVPVVVENDANALAFGELHRGAGRGLQSLVALFLENGLGAGIITNGELHRGALGEAGEIGYLLMDRASLTHSKAHPELGDLEDRIGPRALTRRARDKGIPIPPTGLMTADDIFGIADDGNVAAREIAEEILDMVAIAIAAIVIILDPELVVVGGGLVGVTNRVIPGIQERLTGRIIRVPRLEAATRREDSVILGAAELAAAEVNGFAYLAG